MHRVTADFMTLMNQAGSTAQEWLARAKHIIGEERVCLSVEERLRLAIQLADVMACDYQASSILVAAQNISDSIDRLSQAIENLGFYPKTE